MIALYEFLKKWWLRSISLLLATSLPSVVLYFQSVLVPYISQVSPVAILWICTINLWLTLLLLAYIFINRQIVKWDKRTGTWMDTKSGFRYCAKCKPQTMSPLKEKDDGWKCPVCNVFFPDPENQKPSIFANSPRFKR
jgi:hypothetical protein